MIVPSDATHDFTPTEAPTVTVGQEIVIQHEIAGEVTDLDGSGPLYVFVVTDDEGGESLAYITDGATYPHTWEKIYLYRRTPKPSRGTLFTAGDGSRWVYPGRPHGLYRCWQAGTVHGEGLKHRALIDGLVAD